MIQIRKAVDKIEAVIAVGSACLESKETDTRRGLEFVVDSLVDIVDEIKPALSGVDNG